MYLSIYLSLSLCLSLSLYIYIHIYLHICRYHREARRGRGEASVGRWSRPGRLPTPVTRIFSLSADNFLFLICSVYICVFYIYIYIYIHTYTYIYIYIYKFISITHIFSLFECFSDHPDQVLYIFFPRVFFSGGVICPQAPVFPGIRGQPQKFSLWKIMVEIDVAETRAVDIRISKVSKHV